MFSGYIFYFLLGIFFEVVISIRNLSLLLQRKIVAETCCRSLFKASNF